MKNYLVLILVGVASFTGGMFTEKATRQPCVTCPDVKCPEAVAISMNRADVSGDIRRFKGDIDNSLHVSGNVYLITCGGDTVLSSFTTRSLDSLTNQ